MHKAFALYGGLNDLCSSMALVFEYLALSSGRSSVGEIMEPLGDRGSLEEMSVGWTFASTPRSPSLLVFVVEAVLSWLLAPAACCHASSMSL